MRRSVCWRRHDHPGHEVAALAPGLAGGWRLSGTAVLAYRGTPCALTYDLDLDGGWRTRGGFVAGGIGADRVEVLLLVDEAGRWSVNGVEVPEVAGCLDADLAFSPSTNLLPIRRLGLAVGASAEVRAAWLRFPEMALEPLEQRYTRVGERDYLYESRGGAFRAELGVDEVGLVTRYGDIWSAEASA